MTFGPVLEVGLGLIFVFLVLSLVTSALNEAVAGFLSRRASFFEKWLRQQLNEDQVKRFFEHPMVRSMSGNRLVVIGRRKLKGITWAQRPSYLQPRVFSLVLLDILLGPDGEGTKAGGAKKESAQDKGAKNEGEQDRASDPVSKLEGGRVKAVLTTATRFTGTELDRARQELEQWFDHAMERVAGWYKRRTQLWLWIFGLIMALVLNVDTLLIARTLWTEPAARRVVTEQAEQFAQANPELEEEDLKEAVSRVRNLNTFQIPIGWAKATKACAEPGTQTADSPGEPPCDPRSWPRTPGGRAQRVLGWLITAAALTLGAPFWFDLLKKVVAVRASGRSPKEPTTPGRAAEQAAPA